MTLQLEFTLHSFPSHTPSLTQGGLTNQRMTLRRVVFPASFGPISFANNPSSTEKVIPSRT